MIQKFKNKNLIKKIVIIFLMLQPLLDLKILYSDQIMNIFKFSPSTIIRMVMVLLLFLLVYMSKKHGKDEKYLYVSGVIMAIYFVLHHINSTNFTANVTGTLNYSIIAELFYFVRMLIPIFIIYITYNIDFNRTELKKIFFSTTFVFSIVIIISSIFKFGIASYGGGSLKAGFLDWFTNKNLYVADSACQGIFAGANRLGVLLSAILPINLYYYLMDKKNGAILVILSQILALMIIGTKVASYVWIMVIIIILILYFLFCILRKKCRFNIKKIIILILTFVMGIIVLKNSPITNSTIEQDEIKAIQKEEINNNYTQDVEDAKNNTINGKVEYIRQLVNSDYSYLWINKIYLTELYNFEIDPDFWVEMIGYPLSVRHNDRKIQEAIIERILSINNNKYDKLFGIGYSRFKNSKIYLEEDFFMQSYSMGIIGMVLLLGVYIFTLLMAFVYIIKNFKKNFRFELLVYCCSLSIFVFTSMLCGHVVDEMITYIFMALVSSLILKQIYLPKKKLSKARVEEKITVIVPVYNVENYLEECLDSILKQNVKDLEVILVNDKSTDSGLEICKRYVKEYGFKLINNRKNSGPAISRNKAIKAATGNYIAFLDSDDLLYDDNLSVLYNVAKKEKADIVMSKLNSFNSKGKFGYYSDKYMADYYSGNIYENKKLVNCISICSKIYRASLIKDIKFLENTLHEDNSFTLISYFKAKKIVTVPKYLYYRRVRELKKDSIMQNLNYKTFSDLIKNYKNVIENIDVNHNINFLYKYMIRQLCNNIVKHVKKEEIALARKDIDDFIIYINEKNRVRTLKYYYKTYYSIVILARRVLRHEK